MAAGKTSLCMSRIYCKHRNVPNLVIYLQGDFSQFWLGVTMVICEKNIWKYKSTIKRFSVHNIAVMLTDFLSGSEFSAGESVVEFELVGET